jgi:chloride channel 3/4/5
MCDLTPDTLCTFSPDPSEQPDARSALGNDEDMEANVLYAVATPGILKLWPWVNQVCHFLQHTSTFLSQTRIRCLSRSLPSYLLRLLCSSSKEWGMYTTFTSQRVLFLFLFLTGPPFPSLPSPRVILVEDFGMLVGLTTVKDVLHLEPHEQLNSPIIAWSNRGALDGALEELWTWLADMRSSVNAWYSRISRRWR